MNSPKLDALKKKLADQKFMRESPKNSDLPDFSHPPRPWKEQFPSQASIQQESK